MQAQSREPGNNSCFSVQSGSIVLASHTQQIFCNFVLALAALNGIDNNTDSDRCVDDIVTVGQICSNTSFFVIICNFSVFLAMEAVKSRFWKLCNVLSYI